MNGKLGTLLGFSLFSVVLILTLSIYQFKVVEGMMVYPDRTFSNSLGDEKENTRATDTKTILQLREKCDLDQTFQCIELGRTLYQKKLYLDAAEVFRKVCLQGAKGACFFEGRALFRAKDREAAKEVFNKACEDGDGDSCGVLAYFYYSHDKNKAETERHFLQACHYDSPTGCYNLGIHFMYDSDNERMARKYLKKGCETLNHEESCRTLAWINLSNPIHQDDGRQWYLSQCKSGSTKDCQILGTAEVVVLKDPQGYSRWNSLCDGGDELSCIDTRRLGIFVGTFFVISVLSLIAALAMVSISFGSHKPIWSVVSVLVLPFIFHINVGSFLFALRNFSGLHGHLMHSFQANILSDILMTLVIVQIVLFTNSQVKF